MKIVDPYHEILYPSSLEDWVREFKLIERCGRVAYKSEDKIDEGTWGPFIEKIVKRDHGAVLEFGAMTVFFCTDRGVSHELVRHRLCSFMQESTRYCNYDKEKFGTEISYIYREFNNKNDEWAWREALRTAEHSYMNMVRAGSSPQEARSVLPNSLKTDIVVKANFREWRHIFKLRAVSKAAHPDMRRVMLPLYETLREQFPFMFDVGSPEY